MNFLCRPDAEGLLSENDYARLWPLFTGTGRADAARVGGGWFTAPVRDQYRAVWNAGLTGGCNYYRASPLRPPLRRRGGDEDRVPPESSRERPTLVIWAEDDTALPIGLIDGLDAFVPEMRLVRVPGATHWIIHERPALSPPRSKASRELRPSGRRPGARASLSTARCTSERDSSGCISPAALSRRARDG